MKNPSSPANRYRLLKMTIIYILLSVLCTSCTMFETKPQTAKKQKEPVVEPVISEIQQQQSIQSPYAELEKKGDGEIKAGDYRSALNTYNKLLSKYSGKDKKNLLIKIEALLSIMKNSDLEIVLNSKKSLIPESMLLYRIGMNYMKKEENLKAKDIFTKFISEYPDDKRAEEVRKILKELETLSFAKNAIGCMLPLSGKYQTFGRQALRGIQMAQEDLKASFNGQEIKFVIKDTESKDDKAVACVQELAQTNVAAIAGPMVTSEAAAKEAQKQQIPMICMTQKSEVTAAGDYIFANFITPEMQTHALVSYARQILGIEKFAVLSPNDKYGQTFLTLFRQAVPETGGQIIFNEVYRENQTDFSSVIKKLASILPQSSKANTESVNTTATATESATAMEIKSRTESGTITNGATATELPEQIAIFIPDSPARIALILPQLLYNNISNAYLLGTNIWHNTAVLKIPSEHTQNTVITSGYFAKSSKTEAARFAEAFKSVYGEEPGFIEAVAYDTVSLLVKTAMDKEVDSRLSLKNALAGNIIYNGVTGETMFEVNGNARKELFFLKIENNTFVEIKP